ncbi:hypothetical protein PO124_08410 [Bacillus licheniformis]|nr:hypothetical protein [Bacillus licheniformis]
MNGTGKAGSCLFLQHSGRTGKKLAGDAVLLDIVGDMRLIVTPSSDQRQGTYIFQTFLHRKEISFKLPLFSEYGSLSPMEYGYDPRHELFYTYQPNESGSLYDLISVNLKSGKREVIREKWKCFRLPYLLTGIMHCTAILRIKSFHSTQNSSAPCDQRIERRMDSGHSRRHHHTDRYRDSERKRVCSGDSNHLEGFKKRANQLSADTDEYFD